MTTTSTCTVCSVTAVYYYAGDWYCISHIPTLVADSPPPVKNGEWVRATDFLALEKRIEALERIIIERTADS